MYSSGRGDRASRPDRPFHASADQAPAFARRTADLLAPCNPTDLCNPAGRNMYPFTGTV